jgi:acyl-CoA thioester hydrolase
MKFTGADGKVKVEAKSTWAMIERATGRPIRVTPEIAGPFLA